MTTEIVADASTLTPEQAELQARARAFVEEVLFPLEVEAERARGRLPAERIAAICAAGRRPRARSASTSSGISTSSTKARARACSSACSGVSVDAEAAISVVMDPWG